jgi:hypothetical protein
VPELAGTVALRKLRYDLIQGDAAFVGIVQNPLCLCQIVLILYCVLALEPLPQSLHHDVAHRAIKLNGGYYDKL